MDRFSDSSESEYLTDVRYGSGEYETRREKAFKDVTAGITSTILLGVTGAVLVADNVSATETGFYTGLLIGLGIGGTLTLIPLVDYINTRKY